MHSSPSDVGASAVGGGVGVNDRYAGQDTDIERRCQRHNIDMTNAAKAAKQFQVQ